MLLDTVYDVTIPNDAEVIEIPSDSSPKGVFRSNKIILEIPKLVNDEYKTKEYIIDDIYATGNTIKVIKDAL